MPLSYNDWMRDKGWDVNGLGAGLPPPNPWNLATTHNLKFHGDNTSPGTGTLDDYLENTTRGGATEGKVCTWSSISTNQDQVTVLCLRDNETYTIVRTVAAGVSTLECDGGASGGASWTAEEGG
jgi:hypothetical protein